MSGEHVTLSGICTLSYCSLAISTPLDGNFHQVSKHVTDTSHNKILLIIYYILCPHHTQVPSATSTCQETVKRSMPVGAHNLVSTPLIPAVVDHSRFTATWTVSTSSSREEWMDLSTSTETGMPTWRDSEIWKVNTGLDWTSCTASPLEQLVQNCPLQ